MRRGARPQTQDERSQRGVRQRDQQRHARRPDQLERLQEPRHGVQARRERARKQLRIDVLGGRPAERRQGEPGAAGPARREREQHEQRELAALEHAQQREHDHAHGQRQPRELAQACRPGTGSRRAAPACRTAARPAARATAARAAPDRPRRARARAPRTRAATDRSPRIRARRARPTAPRAGTP